MKKHSLLVFSLLAVCAIAVSLSIVSCASLSKKTVKQKTETFAGDFDPIELGTIMSVSNSVFSGVKPREITIWYIPRNNNIEWYFSDSIDKVALVIPYKTRKNLDEAVQKYMTSYNEGLASLPERSPTKKNYYTTGSISVSWGVLGAGRNGTATYTTNYEYLEPNKPYFVLTINSAKDESDTGVYSNQMKLYFSPAQLEAFYEKMSDESLELIISEKEKQAAAF